MKHKDYDEAIEWYEKALEVDPKNHVVFSNRSAAYLSKGDGLGALCDADMCVDLNPNWGKSYVRRGAALHKLKRYQDAIEAYEKGLEVDPDNVSIKKGLEEVKLAKLRSEPKRNYQSGGSGKGAGAGGGLFTNYGNIFGPDTFTRLAGHPKYSKWLEDPQFKQKLTAMQKNPNNINEVLKDQQLMEVWGWLMGIDMDEDKKGKGGGGEDSSDDGDVKMGEAEDKAAETFSKPAVPANPKLKEALEAKERGNAHYKKREFDEAIVCYNEAIALNPKNMAYLNNKAAAHLERGDTDACIATCKEAIELGRVNRADYKDIAKSFVRMGKAASKKEDYDAAIEHYKCAQVEHFSKEIERLIKNTQLEAKKKQAAAYVDPEKALEAKERGNTNFRAGQWKEAIVEYEEAVKRDPQSAVYRNNLASALTKVADFNGAKAAVEKALELDPNYVKAWAKKGDIEFFMKEYHRALDSYKAGLKVEPNNQLCTEGIRKTGHKIQESSHGEVDKERAAHAMADPEIQAILADPMVNQALRDMSSDPKAAMKVMQDPMMSKKIEKLIAAGVLQTR